MIAVTVMTVRGDAQAPTPTAAEQEAERLAKAGDFVGAAGKFRAAYAADPRADLMCNIGVAYFKAKTEMPRAQLFLSRCLERGSALDAKFMDSVRSVLAAVEAQLRTGAFTPVDVIVSPPGASVAIDSFEVDEGFVGSRVVWLAAGSQTLNVTAEGYTTKQVVILTSGHDRMPVVVKLEKPAPVEPVEVVGAGSGAGSGSAEPAKPPPEIIVKRPARIPAARPSIVPPLVTTGVTIAALVVASVAYGKAGSRADLSAYALTDGVVENDKAYITKWNSYMAGAAVVAIVGAGFSGLLWARYARTPAPIEIAPTEGGVSMAFRATW